MDLTGLCISSTFWELSYFQSRILFLKSSFFRDLVPFEASLRGTGTLRPGHTLCTNLSSKINPALRERCAEKSLLELWEYDESVIANLTKADIVEAVNSVTKSPGRIV